MNKIRKILVGVSAACVMACAAGSIAACGAPVHTHDWSDWTEKSAADCTHAQVLQRDCQDENCPGGGHEEKDGDAALDHQWNWTEKSAADCTHAKVEERTCSRAGCGEHEERNAGEKLGHDWDWTVVNPEGETDGSAAGVCKRDSSHTANVTLPADLTAEGYSKSTTATCTDAGKATYTYTDPTYGDVTFELDEEPLGHDWNWSVTAPVGENTGSAAGVCKHDGAHTATVELPALSSADYVKGEDSAKCLAPGEQLYTYTDPTYGDVSFKVATGAKGHNMVWDTTTTAGKAYYGCTNEGCEEKEEFGYLHGVLNTHTINKPLVFTADKDYYCDGTKSAVYFSVELTKGITTFTFTTYTGDFKLVTAAFMDTEGAPSSITTVTKLTTRIVASSSQFSNGELEGAGLSWEYVKETDDIHLKVDTSNYSGEGKYLLLQFNVGSKDPYLTFKMEIDYKQPVIHNYVNWQVDSAPTDEDAGSARGVCDKSCGDTECAKKKAITLPALTNASLSFYDTQRVEGTGGEKGKTVYTVKQEKADELFGGAQFSFDLYDLGALTYGDNNLNLSAGQTVYTFTSATAREYSINAPLGVAVNIGWNSALTASGDIRTYNFTMTANQTVKIYLTAQSACEANVKIGEPDYPELAVGVATQFDVSRTTTAKFNIGADFTEGDYLVTIYGFSLKTQGCNILLTVGTTQYPFAQGVLGAKDTNPSTKWTLQNDSPSVANNVADYIVKAHIKTGDIVAISTPDSAAKDGIYIKITPYLESGKSFDVNFSDLSNTMNSKRNVTNSSAAAFMVADGLVEGEYTLTLDTNLVNSVYLNDTQVAAANVVKDATAKTTTITVTLKAGDVISIYAQKTLADRDNANYKTYSLTVS